MDMETRWHHVLDIRYENCVAWNTSQIDGDNGDDDGGDGDDGSISQVY